MINAIIFDLGGIVVFPEVEMIPQDVATYIDVDYNSFIEFYNTYKSDLTKGKISLIDVYAEVIKHFKLEKFTAKDIVDKHLQLFQSIIENLNEDVLVLVEKLKKHYLVVCLVNAEADVVPLVRKRGIYNHFQHAYISTEMGMEKPDSEIYETVLKDIKCQPNEVVFIDDNRSNIIEAEKLGIYSILFKNNEELIKEFKNLKLVF